MEAGTAVASDGKARFDSVIGLIGLPRSGTTIVSRALSSSPGIVAEIEPYHSRRQAEFEETAPSKFFSGIGAEERAGCSLLVKETMTRSKNTKLLFDLLTESREAGYETLYVFVLRSPLDAFLSQVSAAKSFWRRAQAFENNEQSFGWFHHTFRVSMRHFIPHAFKFRRHAIVYERFVENPRPWVRRLFDDLGYELSPGPILLEEETGPRLTGDPKARESRVVSGDGGDKYAEAREDLAERYGHTDQYKLLKAVHDIVASSKDKFPGTDSLLRSVIAECRAAIAAARP